METAATQMDPEIILLSKVRQRKPNICNHLYVESKKKKLHRWTYLQNSNRLTEAENKLMVTKGKRGEEGLIRSLGLTESDYHL